MFSFPHVHFYANAGSFVTSNHPEFPLNLGRAESLHQCTILLYIYTIPLDNKAPRPGDLGANDKNHFPSPTPHWSAWPTCSIPKLWVPPGMHSWIQINLSKIAAGENSSSVLAVHAGKNAWSYKHRPVLPFISGQKWKYFEFFNVICSFKAASGKAEHFPDCYMGWICNAQKGKQLKRIKKPTTKKPNQHFKTKYSFYMLDIFFLGHFLMKPVSD